MSFQYVKRIISTKKACPKRSRMAKAERRNLLKTIYLLNRL